MTYVNCPNFTRCRCLMGLTQEFIVRTRRSHFPDVFVARRYGDFRTLANEVSYFFLSLL
jgi:hypothetical protein